MLDLLQGAFEVQQLDLADLSSVKSFANRLQREPRIDLLMLNAGVAGVPLTYTKDNFEMQVGTNHFGHFVLVESLLVKLKQQVRDNVSVKGALQDLHLHLQMICFSTKLVARLLNTLPVPLVYFCRPTVMPVIADRFLQFFCLVW